MKKDLTLAEAVLAHAASQPDKTAVFFKKQAVTYGALAERMKTAALIMRDEYGVKRGDRVMMSAISKPEYIVVLLAVQYLGAISVPVDKSSLGESLVQLYKYVTPVLLISDTATGDEELKKVSFHDFYQNVIDRAESGAADSLEYTRPDMHDIAEIIFTTGTTGTPKGAMLSYNAVWHISDNTIKGTGRTADDIELIPLPVNHSFGMRVLRAMLYLGGTIVLQNGFMFIKETRSNIENFGCTGISIVAASLEMLYRSFGDQFTEVFGKLRRIEVGASSLSVAMKKTVITILPDVTLLNVWGSSETGGAIFLNATEHPDRLETLGYPADGIEIRFIGPDGKEVPGDSPETCGRMVLRGEMQMSGYYGRQDLTDEALIDGCLYTNDLAYRLPDGFVCMLGRADDIINVGGEKVSPVEVENTAGAFSQIRECACISGSDKEGIYEQVPVLFLVPDACGFDEGELKHFLSSRLEQYKIPKYFVEVDELPRNRMLKVDRKELKKRWEGSMEPIKNNAVVSAILGRRSIRDFQDRPVPHEILESLAECAVMAPTGHNRQTWRFTILEDQNLIGRLKAVAAEAASRKKVMFYGFNEPKAVILVSNDRRNDDGVQDSACAAENIMLAAHSYGLGASWVNALMTISDEPDVREFLDTLGIPEKHIVWATVVLGYPAGRPPAPARKKDVIHWI